MKIFSLHLHNTSGTQVPINNQQIFRAIFLQAQKLSKLTYKKSIQGKATKPIKSKMKWLKDGSIPLNQPVQLQHVYSFLHKYTNCLSVQSFSTST